MEFEYPEAEETYRTIVNHDSVYGLTELLGRPIEYLEALEENEELTPEDLEKDTAAQRAFEILDDADLLRQDGDIRTYLVEEYDQDARREVFEKIDSNREELLR